MLRRINGATIAHERSVLTGRGWVTFTIGRRPMRVGKRIHWRDFDAAVQAQQSYPVYITTIDGRTYWQFQDGFYSARNGLVGAEVYALILSSRDRLERTI
jgi:hypothetical protein